MNIEDRQFWGNTSMLGPKLAIGTVVLNLPGQPIVRVDLGWAIGSESSFALTVGAEQHFR